MFCQVMQAICSKHMHAVIVPRLTRVSGPLADATPALDSMASGLFDTVLFLLWSSLILCIIETLDDEGLAILMIGK